MSTLVPDASPASPLPDPPHLVRRLLEHFPDGVLQLDGGCRVVYANPAAAAALGTSGAPLVGAHIRASLPQALRSLAFAAYAEVRRCDAPARFTATLRDCTFEVRLHPSRDGVAVYLRDVTEERANDERLRALLATAEEGRLAAEAEARLRAEVVTVVSHDVKNPLHAILLHIDDLRDTDYSREVQLQRLERMTRVVHRMRRLVDRLLSMRRYEEGQSISIAREPVDVQRLLEEVDDVLSGRARRKGVRLRFQRPAGPTLVWGDEDRLVQVLWNLTDNAIKYTPGGADVVVRVEREERWIRFSVTDHGAGIPDEHLPHLFDLYWQDKRTARLGTGVGLPIARAIVEAHGGTLDVTSEPDVGSTFAFTVPVAPE